MHIRRCFLGEGHCGDRAAFRVCIAHRLEQHIERGLAFSERSGYKRLALLRQRILAALLAARTGSFTAPHGLISFDWSFKRINLSAPDTAPHAGSPFVLERSVFCIEEQ
jgi:hypothetical protein